MQAQLRKPGLRWFLPAVRRRPVLDLLPLPVHPVRRFEIAAGMGDQLLVGRMVDRLDAGDNPHKFGRMRVEVLQ